MPRRAPASHPDARRIIELVVDAGSWDSWDRAVDTVHPGNYEDELRCVRTKTGYDEAVVTGCASVRGHRVALIVGEFGFLGGSIGVDAGNRITEAVQRATAEGLAVLALPTSGGTRMQEGTTAFLQMVRITAAVDAHKAAGLPYLVYLRHPTTGGVLASWGSLGHITLAEPDALVGFLGPRVYETMTGVPFPGGVQTSENLHLHGIVDAVVAPERLGDELASILGILRVPDRVRSSEASYGARPSGATSWECVEQTRSAHRPGIREVLDDEAVHAVLLSGSGEGDIDDAVVVALARLDGRRCVLVAQDRSSSTPIGVAGLRAARRGIRLAQELRLPLVTVIDTAGAELSGGAEEHGIAGQIARCLSAMIGVSVPTVSVLLGQGGGGAALALLPADRVVAAEHGWLSPLPPEGASAIVFRDVDHAAEMADRQGIGCDHLLASGLIDVIVPEEPSAQSDPALFCRRVVDTVAGELTALGALEESTRRSARLRRVDMLASRSPAPV